MTHTSIFALGVALALAASPALAQTSTSPSTQRGPAATGPSGSSATTTRNQLPSDISAMKAGDLVGQDVYDDKGDRIGEVDDVVMNKSNRQAAAVIGVGGFLGIGERKAAIPLNQLKVQGDKIVGTGLTKDSVKSMAEYKDSDNDQWDKMDRERMLSEASSGATGSSGSSSGGAIRPGGSTSSTPGATNPSSGSATDRSGASSSGATSSSSGSSSMPSGTSGTSGSTSSPGTATGSPSNNSSAPSGATSPSGSSGSSMGTGSGSSNSGSSSANPAASSNPPDNSTATQKK